MDLRVFEIFDSRGSSTLKAVMTVDNVRIESSVPSGKSTGSSEVKAYNGTIDDSIGFFYANKARIIDLLEAANQKEFDSGINDLYLSLGNAGGALSLVLSYIYLKYSAYKEHYSYLNEYAKVNDIPKPLGNVFGGGLHSNNLISVQEILALNLDDEIYQNVYNNISLYKHLEDVLKKSNTFFAKNDEGAISANISFQKALDLVSDSIDSLGLNTKIGLDMAASSFYKDGFYNFEGKSYSQEDFVDYLVDFFDNNRNIVYVEDPFFEESFESFSILQSSIDALVCGDDLYTTNVQRIMKGIEYNSTKAVLIKPNQIGNLSDTFAAIKLAKDNGLTCVISHRSGETEDSVISDLAVGMKVPFIKTGTISGERVVKLNRLIEISLDLEE